MSEPTKRDVDIAVHIRGGWHVMNYCDATAIAAYRRECERAERHRVLDAIEAARTEAELKRVIAELRGEL